MPHAGFDLISFIEAVFSIVSFTGLAHRVDVPSDPQKEREGIDITAIANTTNKHANFNFITTTPFSRQYYINKPF